MRYYEKLMKIEKIYRALQDEKSKNIFKARIDYMIDRDEERLYETTDSLDCEWYCEEVEEILKKNATSKLVVYGCGHDGKRTKKVLDQCGHSPLCFCDSDNNKVGTVVDGIPVITIDELIEKNENIVIIIGSRKYMNEIYTSLLSKGFPAKKILCSQFLVILGQWGNQYFDLFEPSDSEIFIDAGAYDGDTVLRFVEWTKGTYKKIYAFEPSKKACGRGRDTIQHKALKNILFYEYAVWNRKETLSFKELLTDSRLEEGGKTIVEGIDIDSVVKEDVVTYIKMDVEGSELRALEGAKNTIIKNKPKLAICLYHKPEDILELPLYILELVPEYKFYIRHYTSKRWETVLYAML